MTLIGSNLLRNNDLISPDDKTRPDYETLGLKKKIPGLFYASGEGKALYNLFFRREDTSALVLQAHLENGVMCAIVTPDKQVTGINLDGSADEGMEWTNLDDQVQSMIEQTRAASCNPCFALVVSSNAWENFMMAMAEDEFLLDCRREAGDPDKNLKHPERETPLGQAMKRVTAEMFLPAMVPATP